MCVHSPSLGLAIRRQYTILNRTQRLSGRGSDSRHLSSRVIRAERTSDPCGSNRGVRIVWCFSYSLLLFLLLFLNHCRAAVLRRAGLDASCGCSLGLRDRRERRQGSDGSPELQNDPHAACGQRTYLSTTPARAAELPSWGKPCTRAVVWWLPRRRYDAAPAVASLVARLRTPALRGRTETQPPLPQHGPSLACSTPPRSIVLPANV
ncbi:hypothetical protein QBC47DRAFT_210020 [Echria macrotheca]|uniref:Uncharacterized protein n=1 Tax=Echria macrotheca TaxID=438768 RepID=A0AAJ0BFY5_9PEZI|nr:hypothetical protein QBC47DRAFT_210020 [Echria macrotheca]